MNLTRDNFFFSLVQKLEECVRRNDPIPAVNSNIIRIIRHGRKKKGLPLEGGEDKDFSDEE